MARRFNVTGSCDSELHYMVDISDRLEQIKALIDNGAYFTINRARQYGKTTTLDALTEYLKKDYIVISLDFQLMEEDDFSSGTIFSKAFVRYLLQTIRNRRSPVRGLDTHTLERMEKESQTEDTFTLSRLFPLLSDLCDTAEKPVVLIIDEVDSASNNQVFLDFLAQIRGYYLKRKNKPTFQSVILAGVHDVKNIKMKIRPEEARHEPKVHTGMCADDLTGTAEQFVSIPVEAHKVNSPWNIATDFLIDMSFNTNDIKGMLAQYEADHHTGMDMDAMAKLLYAYTSGYPYLVSRLCQLMDERIAGTERFSNEQATWTKDGFLEAVKILLSEKNTLFESLMGKLYDYPELKRTVYNILFGGEQILFNPLEYWMDVTVMYGFAKNNNGTLVIANRIFEVCIYNYFLATSEAQDSDIFRAAAQNKSQFIHDGRLDMKLILERFVVHFDQIYGDKKENFDEEEGRRRFLLYLRPIINGTGNYYIESETRNGRRMDVVVDYLGEQFVIELKIWRGNAYNERGEEQISDYLDSFHLKKGYMLSYNFNQKKEIGVREIAVGDRILVEAVV